MTRALRVASYLKSCFSENTSHHFTNKVLFFPILPIFLLASLSEQSALAQVSRQEIALVQRYIEQQVAPLSKSVAKFAGLTRPYAPLDFQVRQGSNTHASAVRNVIFGYAGATANLDTSVTPKMANDFHCGEPCARERIKVFLDQNQRISLLVKHFLMLSNVGLIAQWEVSGDLRINDTFLQQGIITKFSPVGASGILPNSYGKVSSSLLVATGLAGANITETKAIATELAALHLSAIVQSPQGVRVIRTGNADNQYGLLFKGLSIPEPKTGDNFGEGLEVVGVTRLAQDIYYFETT